LNTDASGVGSSGDDEHPLSLVGGTHPGRGEQHPLRIEPEVGQVPKYGSDGPNNSSVCPLDGSHRPAVPSHDANTVRVESLNTVTLGSFRRAVELGLDQGQDAGVPL
jgi:hypothetical protein